MKLITSKDQSKDAAIFILNKFYGDLKEYNNGTSIAYYRDSDKKVIMVFSIKSEFLWVVYDEIWSILKMMFKFRFIEISEAVEEWVNKSYDLNIVDGYIDTMDSLGFLSDYK